jgi:hypothetical protein
MSRAVRPFPLLRVERTWLGRGPRSEFAHMKRILRLDRLRLRGLNGVRDEVLLTATAQNLRRLVKLTCRPHHLWRSPAEHPQAKRKPPTPLSQKNRQNSKATLGTRQKRVLQHNRGQSGPHAWLWPSRAKRYAGAGSVRPESWYSENKVVGVLGR